MAEDSTWPPRSKQRAMITVGIPLSAFLALGGIGANVYSSQETAKKEDVQRELYMVETRLNSQMRETKGELQAAEERVMELEKRLSYLGAVVDNLKARCDARARRRR